MTNGYFFAPVVRTERRRFNNQITDIRQSQVMNTLLETAGGIEPGRIMIEPKGQN